jgi:hypothetical protein
MNHLTDKDFDSTAIHINPNYTPRTVENKNETRRDGCNDGQDRSGASERSGAGILALLPDILAGNIQVEKNEVGLS